MGASTMLSRVNTLVNVGYGEELDNDSRSGFANLRSSFADSETWAKPNLRSSFTDLRNTIQEEYINDEDWTVAAAQESQQNRYITARFSSFTQAWFFTGFD